MKKQVNIRLDVELLSQIDLFVKANPEIKNRTEFFEFACEKYMTNAPQTLADLHSDMILLAQQHEQHYQKLSDQIKNEQKNLLEKPKSKRKGLFGFLYNYD